jgi:DNA-binding MarR family transcriptional regulator
MDQHGVTGPQLVALQEAARLGTASVSALARNVHVSHPTMTGILDRLEKRGLVKRGRDEKDRRVVTISVTANGSALLDAAPSPLQDRFRDEIARQEEWEQTLMLSTLQRIAAMMQAEDLEAFPVLATETVVDKEHPPSR